MPLYLPYALPDDNYYCRSDFPHTLEKQINYKGKMKCHFRSKLNNQLIILCMQEPSTETSDLSKQVFRKIFETFMLFTQSYMVTSNNLLKTLAVLAKFQKENKVSFFPQIKIRSLAATLLPLQPATQGHTSADPCQATPQLCVSQNASLRQPMIATLP